MDIVQKVQRGLRTKVKRWLRISTHIRILIEDLSRSCKSIRHKTEEAQAKTWIKHVIRQHWTCLVVHQLGHRILWLNWRMGWRLSTLDMCAPDVTPNRAPSKLCNMYVGVYNASDVSGWTPDMVLKEVANTIGLDYTDQTCLVSHRWPYRILRAQ